MFKKFKKYFKIVNIDVFIYKMTLSDIIEIPNIDYKINQRTLSNTKKEYYISDNDVFVHRSILFTKLNLLKIIDKKGPAIGECLTAENYKGKSIYPFVINKIATEILLSNKNKEVFVLVNTNNTSSIRGIEKAGFKLHCKIKAKRFLLFYYNIINELAIDKNIKVFFFTLMSLEF